MVKIDFEFDTPHGVFRDALHLPDDHAFTEDEIQAMKQRRVDNWIAIVTAPSAEPAEEPAPVVKELAPEYIEIDGVRYVRV